MDVKQLQAWVLQRILGLSQTLRLALGFSFAAVLGLAYLVSQDRQPTTDAMLFTGLDAEDAGVIVAKLKELHVPYELDAGGSLIRVPSQQVHELRLQMAQAGLPRGGGVGFEIFDRPTYGQSDFVQQKNYARALQGELERTISAMSSIAKARVHLVLPERRLFAQPNDSASASVVIKMRPGRVLADGQSAAIVHLVASSVAGLSPQKVTLVDDSGRVLSAPASGGAGGSGEELAHKRRVEVDLEQKLARILDKMVGDGHSSVQVSASLAFNQVEKTEEVYDPEHTALRSEQATEETHTASQPMARNEGVPGVRSNVVGADAQTQVNGDAGASNNQTQKRATTRNFEVNKVVSHTVFGRAQLERITAAVLVDGQYKGEERKFEPLPAEQLDALSLVLKQAMGFDEKRGDQLVVRCVPFSFRNEEEAPASSFEEWRQTATKWGTPAASSAVILLALAGVVLFSRGRRVPSTQLLLPEGPRTVREVQAYLATQQGHPAADGAESSQFVGGSVAQASLGAADTARSATVVKGWLQAAKKEKSGGKSV